MRFAERWLPACALLVLALAPAALRAQAAEGTPAWIVERFFQHEEWSDRAAYLGGEMEQYAGEPTPGNQMPAGTPVTARELQADSQRAIYAVSIRRDGRTYDAYVYLDRDANRWRITAVRLLALPAFFYMGMDSLQAMPDRTPAYEQMLTNMRLTAASDSALKQHFVEHADQFEALATAGAALDAAELPILADHEGGGAPSPSRAAIRNALPRLGLASMQHDEEAPGCLLLVIGGIMDNSVGYLYAPPGCAVPRMSPGYFIYLEALRPGWYVYKTT